ncbi:MAG: acetyl-CoA carboxylase carboxyltransferase subunit beta [Candidatus Omnitrophica bacterium]|nr:acetyl-CoA carboxylase carboxyltransferase subunit beta [Candidatus Omnitrophota bacterium]
MSSGKTPAVPQVNGRKKSVPAGLWVKCPDCPNVIFKKTLQENFSVCPKCSHHFVIGAWERVEILIDGETFEETDAHLRSTDPLRFKAAKSYTDKLAEDRKKSGLPEASVTGVGTLNGRRVALAVTDTRFIMGSMGSVVGEKFTRLAEKAEEEKIPLIAVCGSGGGARMYEGMLSLMQMAKTSAAIARLHNKHIPYISVLTHPTMGGVMASFASLGDIIMAEPKALIGFAGPRVIEQTIRQKLPEGFQTSEFLLEHGLIDMVVDRRVMKNKLSNILGYLS